MKVTILPTQDKLTIVNI